MPKMRQDGKWFILDDNLDQEYFTLIVEDSDGTLMGNNLLVYKRLK